MGQGFIRYVAGPVPKVGMPLGQANQGVGIRENQWRASHATSSGALKSPVILILPCHAP
jgi:hypothetical protein